MQTCRLELAAMQLKSGQGGAFLGIEPAWLNAAATRLSHLQPLHAVLLGVWPLAHGSARQCGIPCCILATLRAIVALPTRMLVLFKVSKV